MTGSHTLAVLASCASQIAFAQAQTTSGLPDASVSAKEAQGAQAPSSSGAEVQDIVVTGSRTQKDGSQAPTPVTAVTAETLAQAAPSNIPDALNKLPQFTGSSSQTSGRTFNANSAPLGNYLNLRGLGSQRLLVLLNGQRVPPTTNTNAVDVNVLPQQLVRRVDVVTGGASAVYGSDAVTGVVNFVLDNDFEGLKASAQRGVSDYGDAGSYRLGGAVGKSFGRLHLLASYERYNNDGIPRLFDRKWAPNRGVLLGAGTIASPLSIIPNATRNNLSNGGAVLGGALTAGNPSGVQFRPDGTLVRFDPGQPFLTSAGVNIASNTSIGGDGGIYGEPRNGGTSIAGSLSTHQAFARAAYDISDAIQVFAQGTYAASKTAFTSVTNNHSWGAAGGSRRTTIFADNPYLRPELARQLTDAGQTSFDNGRIFNDVPLISNRSRTEFFSAQAGLAGDLGGSWKWNANYVYGRSSYVSTFNEWDTRRFFAAVDAARDPATGRTVCGVTLRNPGLLPGCVPMNILGDGNISPEAFAYARGDSVSKIVNTMNYGNVNLQGDVFNLPAGAVTLAVGAEYRTQTLSQASNSDPAIFGGTAGQATRAAYFAGIRGVPGSALPFDSINIGSGSGKQTVKEGYGELTVPLLRNTMLAQELVLNLAGRYTDYKTSGGVTTWKVGGSWTPVNGLRVRASQSRDIAAPGLYNLYAGENLTFSQVADPLTGATQIVLLSQSGSLALDPEKADTTTLGVVIQPSFVPRLTISVDAYRVSIKDAIGTQGVADQLADCQTSGGTAPVCALIERPLPFSNTSVANFPSRIRVVPQNLARLTTQGIDFEVSYRIPVPSLGGDLTLRGFANYLDAYDTQGAANQPILKRVGRVTSDQDPFGLPKWKGLLTQTYSSPHLTLSLFERFTGRYALGSPNQVLSRRLVAPNRVYVDANVSYDVGADRRFELFFNVQNLLNTDPPVLDNQLITNLGVPTDKTVYDVVGRYFTAGFRVRL